MSKTAQNIANNPISHVLEGTEGRVREEMSTVPGKCSVPRPGSPVPSTPERREGLRACYWELDGETESDFIFWGSKITADGDFSHEIKRRFVF